ncbi:MAG: hypothetical protein AAFR70_03010 [Pseudomonadota bacterium]
MASTRQPDVEHLRASMMNMQDPALDSGWPDEPKRKRDWKRVVLIFGLGALSWVATYIGMLELIQANMGTLDLGTKIVIGCSVAMLMTMIIWLLDQLFAPLPIATKAAYLAGYVFLTAISVGFGFGFYWKVLESRTEASRSAESAVTQVQGSLTGAVARLDQLQGTLGDLTTVSSAKAIEERERGTSCPNSRPGDGPRRKLRDADAAKFDFAANFVQGRAGQVKTDLGALDADLKKIATGDPSTIDPNTGTRNAFLRGLERKLELTATRFNAFRTDPQLKQIRSDLNQRSGQTIFPTGRGQATFSCPDPQLQTALRGVVRAIDELPILAKPTIATVEGSEAVIEAFRRLSATAIGALAFKLPPSADEMRELQKRAVRNAENNGRQPEVTSGLQGGLTNRDFIPLAIAVFVDLCLLLVSIGRPMNRMDNLVPRMKSAERGPVYRILSKFSEIHRDPEIREKFEVFSHVVFSFNGSQYVAVPLDAPRNTNPDEYRRLRRDAHLLRNLFVSFEKEKIVKPIVNPLLRTGRIQALLEKQGSVFAKARAFQLYRFQDGAWAEIILGAVMGAAKRVETERIYRRHIEGPQLGGADRLSVNETTQEVGRDPIADLLHTPEQTPAPEPEQPGDFPASPQPHEVKTDRPLAAHASHLGVATAAHPAATATASADPATRHAFGPYAAGAARDFAVYGHAARPQAEPVAPTPTPSASVAQPGPSASERDALPMRLRKLRQAKPTEADIEIRTGSPEPTKPDNVVDIAKRRRSLVAEARDITTRGPVDESTLRPTQSPMSVSPMTVAPPPVGETTVEPKIAVDETTVAGAPIAPASDASHVTFRITERTADVRIPVTEATLPLAFLSQVSAALSGGETQATLQTAPEISTAPVALPEPTPPLIEPQPLAIEAPIDANAIEEADIILMDADGDFSEAQPDYETPFDADFDETEPFDPVLSRFAPQKLQVQKDEDGNA